MRGLLAGAAGTLGMDVVRYAGYRAGGGRDRFRDWELSAGLSDWESAPAPAHVAKRLVEGLFQVTLPGERAALVNNVVHWAYGTGWGGVFGLVEGSLPRRRARHGLLFGTLVWLTDYAVLPPMGLYEPIWRYDLRTLAEDLCGHLAYGVGTAGAYRALA